MRNSIYFICVPEAWMTLKFGWWLNTRQNKPKPQILTGSTGWIAANTTSVQWSPWEVLPWPSGQLGQDPSSWATTCLGIPAPEEKPFIGFGLFVVLFCFVWLCRALHTRALAAAMFFLIQQKLPRCNLSIKQVPCQLLLPSVQQKRATMAPSGAA